MMTISTKKTLLISILLILLSIIATYAITLKLATVNQFEGKISQLAYTSDEYHEDVNKILNEDPTTGNAFAIVHRMMVVYGKGYQVEIKSDYGTFVLLSAMKPPDASVSGDSVTCYLEKDDSTAGYTFFTRNHRTNQIKQYSISKFTATPERIGQFDLFAKYQLQYILDTLPSSLLKESAKEDDN